MSKDENYSQLKLDLNEDANVSTQYDTYYKGGNKSLYNKRFGNNRIIPREHDIIYSSYSRIYKKICKKDKKIEYLRVLDFGCGNGRLFPTIEKIAKKFRSKKIELIAYDISVVGLNVFINNIQSKNYIKLDTKKINQNLFIHDIDNKILGYWAKDNIIIKIIHGSINEELYDVVNLICKPIHLIFSIFAVLGHVPKRVNRQMILKTLGSLLDIHGEMIINVSTPSSLLKESISYDLIREQLNISITYNIKKTAEVLHNALRSATESGDLYYTCYDGTNAIDAYGHVYLKEELLEDISKADLLCYGVKVLSIEQPYILSKNIIKLMSDTLLSRFLSLNLNFYPFNKIDKISKNIYTIAYKP